MPLLKNFFLITAVLNLKLVWATHIKAGEISAQRDPTNSNRFFFTLTIYFDASRITTTNQANLVPVNQAALDFGDGSMPQVSNFTSLVNIGNNVVVGVYNFTHTYLTQGTYSVSYTDFNRIGDILNMDNSVSTSLHIDLSLRVDPFIGRNTTPQLQVPPIDIANSGQIFTHNPGAIDPDGDSLSFELIPPKKFQNINVDNYTNPADPKFGGSSTSGGPATFTLNPQSGQIIWDTPGQPGFYNIAIRVNEFRNGILIGYVVRDMQIEVRVSPNRPPIVEVPNDTCFTVGSLLQQLIRVSDPDNHSLLVERYGQPFQTSPAASIAGPSLPANSPSLFTFNWNPGCNLVRKEPYQILVKAQDNVSQNIRLADIKSWNVKLLAPPPKWKSPEKVGQSIKLNWEPYQKVCNRSLGNIRIFRSICDSNFIYNPCQNPKAILNKNFELIATVPLADTTFIDKLTNIGLSQGIVYNYALLVDFPSPAFGNSLPSRILSFKMGIIEPLITNIEVLNKSTTKINFVVPKNIPNATPPYTYTLQRSSTNTNFITIKQIDNVFTLVDTFFMDNDLNTSANQYYYRIILSANGINDLFSNTASTTFLTASFGNQSAILNYNFLPSGEIDKIEIINYGLNQLIDTVKKNSSTYTVKNLVNCDSAFFIVKPISKFCIPGLNSLYMNTSNVVGVLPRDTSQKIPMPSSNTTFCERIDCNLFIDTFTDTIRWLPSGNVDCNSEILYNVYYSSEPEKGFQKLTTTSNTYFVHQKNKFYSGCYYLTVVKDGIESKPSEKFCIENKCGCYELPNIITPNNDGKNDVLRPLKEPILVESVDFKLFNRWGKLIFSKKDDIYINWDARDVPSGHYFYEATVTFHGINKTQKVIKGWIHVVK